MLVSDNSRNEAQSDTNINLLFLNKNIEQNTNKKTKTDSEPNIESLRIKICDLELRIEDYERTNQNLKSENKVLEKEDRTKEKTK